MFFMHNDGLARDGAGKRLLDTAARTFESGEKWGVMFTHYDVLCAFNMAAVRDVGYWDTMFYQYTADSDYYQMLRAAGWPSIDIGGSDVDHRNDASNTHKADPLFSHRTQWRARDGIDYRYYAMKWGGGAGEEKFTRPFQDFLDPGSLKKPEPPALKKGTRA
jgi:GT2 family glycosyltransferase